jgi:hypothetical protein
MKNLASLGLAFLLALTVTGCQLYFGEEKSSGDPGGGNACVSDRDCAAGCHCDEMSGTCIEAGFCSTARDCPDGYKCDERSSCVPGGGSCAAAIAPTCTNGAPRCPQGSVPLIANGCYFDENGDGQFDCSPIAECAAPPTCDRFQYQADCVAGNACASISRGVNCSMSNGQPCADGAAGCVCQMYVFDHCEQR